LRNRIKRTLPIIPIAPLLLHRNVIKMNMNLWKTKPKQQQQQQQQQQHQPLPQTQSITPSPQDQLQPPLLFFVIYSCKKNLSKAQRLYDFVKEKFPLFTLLILYGEPKLKEEYELKLPFLIVKSGDAYEHLSNKTIAMIHTLSEISFGENYRGIIKCDDDILPNLATLQRFYETLISTTENIPYAGLIHSIDKTKRVSNNHFDKCSSPKFNIPQPIVPDCPFATGPMYYLSIPSLLQLERRIRLGSFELSFYEDMMIGNNLRQEGIHPFLFPLYQNEFLGYFGAPSFQNADNQTRTLYVLLHGGLGNQMFQLASAYGLARKQGRYLVALYSNNPSMYPHQNSFQDYTHTIFRNTPCLLATNQMFQDSAVEVYSELGNVSMGFEYHPERIFGVETDPRNQKDVILNGYFQNEQYFREYRQELLDEWQHPLLAEKLQETYPNLSHAYFFHVRRGDYLENSMYQISWDDYYRKALDTIMELETDSTKPVQFYVFSDDNAFCKTYSVLVDALEKFPGRIVFTLIENLGALESMFFMSLCGCGGIASNSSFSWWGGYLNPLSRKMVVLPKQWLATGTVTEEVDMCFDGAVGL